MSGSASDHQGLMRPLVITASLLGIIQGITWTVLSLLAVFIYNDIIHIKNKNNDMDQIICSLYLKKDEKLASLLPKSIIIEPKEFSYFMYLYLVLSFCWLVTSSFTLRNELHGKRDSFHNKTIGAWVGMAAILSSLDLILMCLIAHDYDRYKSMTELVDFKKTAVLAAVGIVMTLAARGFVLWAINVMFAIILGRFCYNTYKKDGNPNQPFIDAYETGPKPWLTHPTYDDPFQSGYDNKGFNHDQDNSLFPPRAKQHPFSDDRNPKNNYKRENERNNGKGMDLPQVGLGRPNNTDNYWSNKSNNRSNTERDYSSPYGQPTPLRTAKIGRQGGQRSPPLNVSSPHIPDPDYSPPGSPQPRGVLRPKTNYAMY